MKTMLTRIYKPAARKLWENCKSFWITPCHMRPDWGLLIDPFRLGSEFASFDALINAFTFYNCTNETGRYPAFYVAE